MICRVPLVVTDSSPRVKGSVTNAPAPVNPTPATASSTKPICDAYGHNARVKA
jgi:hypothetical protein